MDQQVSNLDWQFVTTINRDGTMKWRWQIWTKSGHYIRSSHRDFITLDECKADARTQVTYFPLSESGEANWSTVGLLAPR